MVALSSEVLSSWVGSGNFFLSVRCFRSLVLVGARSPKPALPVLEAFNKYDYVRTE